MFSKLKASRKATSTTVDIPQSAKHANPLQTISRSSTRIFGGSEPKNEHAAEHTSSTPSPPGTFNVVLFGETGVGKSSVINLIARKEIAAVSSDVNGCTMQYKCYDIPFDGVNFAIYDTVGLEEPQMGVNGYLKAIEQAYGLISKLGAAGGIHLLLFCLRGGRITATTQSNYRLFRECLCHKEVPIALVFTGLEREMEMEDWWKRNKKDIEGYGIESDGHACITAVQDDEDDHKFLASQEKIRQLLKECAIKHNPFSPEMHPWFARFTRGMRSFVKGKTNPKEKDLMKVLTRRCKLDQDTARRVVAMIENGDVDTNEGDGETNKGEDVSGDNGPRKEMGPEKNPRTLQSSPSERADPLAGMVNNESVPNGHDKGDSRGMNGDDEPEDGRGAVPGEPATKDNPPPKEHEDPQAGDWEEPGNKSIDESMPNGHGQRCKLDYETARNAAAMMRNSDVDTNKGEDSQERSGNNEPRKEIGSKKNPTGLRSPQSERADQPTSILNSESIPNGRDKEDSRGTNGDDEPGGGREVVHGEPATKDTSPPKKHEDLQAGGGEEPAKKLTDESMSNGHTQRCEPDQETVRKAAVTMENDGADGNNDKDSQERSGDNEPREEIGPRKNSTSLHSPQSECADQPTSILNSESVPNGRDKEYSRGTNGDDEPGGGREVVHGEPATKDTSPPKEHEDLQAGGGEEPAKKSPDESMSNGHDQKGQQAGIKGRGQTKTGQIPTNGNSPLDDPERKEVQQTEHGQGHGRKEAEAATASILSPEMHRRNEHPPARKDESGTRGGQEIGVANSTLDRSSSDKNEKQWATKVQSGVKRMLKGILTNGDPPQNRKELPSDGESDWQFAEREGNQSQAVERKVPGAFTFGTS